MTPRQGRRPPHATTAQLASRLPLTPCPLSRRRQHHPSQEFARGVRLLGADRRAAFEEILAAQLAHIEAQIPSVALGGPFVGFEASGIGHEYGAVGLGTSTE